MSTKIRAEPTPPSMGAAMRFITSAPVPVLRGGLALLDSETGKIGD